jgi:hypothetical protein
VRMKGIGRKVKRCHCICETPRSKGQDVRIVLSGEALRRVQEAGLVMMGTHLARIWGIKTGFFFV